MMPFGLMTVQIILYYIEFLKNKRYLIDKVIEDKGT